MYTAEILCDKGSLIQTTQNFKIIKFLSGVLVVLFQLISSAFKKTHSMAIITPPLYPLFK